MLNNPSTNNTLLLIGRILLAYLFIGAGFGKLMGFSTMLGVFANVYGIPVPAISLPVTILIELGGGLLILFGFMTRPVALILALFTVAAALIAHTKFADQNQMIHFSKNLAIAGGFLALMVSGPGAWSVDGRRKS